MRLFTLWCAFVGLMGAATYLEGGNWQTLVQANAALLVFGPCVAFCFYHYGFNGTFGFAKRLFTNRANETDVEFCDRVGSLGFLCGGTGTLVGMIHVMSHLSDASQLGSGLAVAFLSFLYGMVPSVLFLPVQTGKGGAKVRVLKGGRMKAAGFATGSFLFSLAALFTVLYALTQN